MRKKVELDKYDNSWYNPGPRWKIIIWLLINIFIFKSSLPFPQFLKIKLLKMFGCKLGKNVLIKPNVNIKYPWFLDIGNDVWIGEEVWIDNLAHISIGSNVCISQGAMLLCGNHNYKKTGFDLIVKPITIENGVWIGAQAIVCPGVIIRSHAILSVGSIASKNLNSYKIYKGNPAEEVNNRILS